MAATLTGMDDATDIVFVDGRCYTFDPEASAGSITVGDAVEIGAPAFAFTGQASASIVATPAAPTPGAARPR
jgi:hypothetical protein